ncbi:hypothetical protein BJ165DRAFT_1524180 [Panaeolus papilionaceus]|nr:hypothetical protein BJ165DRAFT_1524180 [Panaeolus papilionaceus]
MPHIILLLLVCPVTTLFNQRPIKLVTLALVRPSPADSCPLVPTLFLCMGLALRRPSPHILEFDFASLLDAQIATTRFDSASPERFRGFDFVLPLTYFLPDSYTTRLTVSLMAETLKFNHSSKASLSPYDGKVGAIIGEFIYTTPNENFIPLPLSGDRKVQVRRDYRYGPDDHTLWPQTYSSLAPHLAGSNPPSALPPIAPVLIRLFLGDFLDATTCMLFW